MTDAFSQIVQKFPVFVGNIQRKFFQLDAILAGNQLHSVPEEPVVFDPSFQNDIKPRITVDCFKFHPVRVNFSEFELAGGAFQNTVFRFNDKVDGLFQNFAFISNHSGKKSVLSEFVITDQTGDSISSDFDRSVRRQDDFFTAKFVADPFQFLGLKGSLSDDHDFSVGIQSLCLDGIFSVRVRGERKHSVTVAVVKFHAVPFQTECFSGRAGDVKHDFFDVLHFFERHTDPADVDLFLEGIVFHRQRIAVTGRSCLFLLDFVIFCIQIHLVFEEYSSVSSFDKSFVLPPVDRIFPVIQNNCCFVSGKSLFFQNFLVTVGDLHDTFCVGSSGKTDQITTIRVQGIHFPSQGRGSFYNAEFCHLCRVDIGNSAKIRVGNRVLIIPGNVHSEHFGRIFDLQHCIGDLQNQNFMIFSVCLIALPECFQSG